MSLALQSPGATVFLDAQLVFIVWAQLVCDTVWGETGVAGGTLVSTVCHTLALGERVVILFYHKFYGTPALDEHSDIIGDYLV